MAALAGLIAHGGLGGLIVELLVALAVVGILVAVWLRERRYGASPEGDARLREEDAPGP